MGTDQDITDLQEIIDQLLDLIFEGQIEMRALQRVLIERHGFSHEALAEYRAVEKTKTDALRRSVDSSTQLLKRFQGPQQ